MKTFQFGGISEARKRELRLIGNLDVLVHNAIDDGIPEGRVREILRGQLEKLDDRAREG